MIITYKLEEPGKISRKSKNEVFNFYKYPTVYSVDVCAGIKPFFFLVQVG